MLTLALFQARHISQNDTVLRSVVNGFLTISTILKLFFFTIFNHAHEKCLHQIFKISQKVFFPIFWPRPEFLPNFRNFLQKVFLYVFSHVHKNFWTKFSKFPRVFLHIFWPRPQICVTEFSKLPRKYFFTYLWYCIVQKFQLPIPMHTDV